jgi:hypothetical protein
MDRYFYSVELDEKDNKVVHMSGNVYFNDADSTETNYRIAEWTFFYIPTNWLKELMKYDQFYDYIYAKVNYLGDLTEEQAIETCARYFGGEPGVYLHITDVDEETPCGNYWFE